VETRRYFGDSRKCPSFHQTNGFKALRWFGLLILPEIWDEQKGLLMNWDEAQKHLFQSRPDLETKFRQVGWTIWRAVCQPESRVGKAGST
jgi:hypothetical protein